MASLLYSSGEESDGDFPAVNALIRRHKIASPTKPSAAISLDDDKENIQQKTAKSPIKPILKVSSGTQRDILSPTKSSIAATPMRRRKLGVGFNGPPVASSLLQPFNDDENVERGCRTARARRMRDESSFDMSLSFTSFKSSRNSTIFSMAPPSKPRYTQTPGRPRLMIDSDEEDHKSRRPKPTPRVKLRQKISKISLISEDSSIGDSVLMRDTTMRSSDNDSSNAIEPIAEFDSENDLSNSGMDSPSRSKSKSTRRSLFGSKEVEADKSQVSEPAKEDQSSFFVKETVRSAEEVDNRIKSLKLIESPSKPKAPAPVDNGLEAAFGKLSLFAKDVPKLTKEVPKLPSSLKHEVIPEEEPARGKEEPAAREEELEPESKPETAPLDETTVASCSTPQRATKSKLLATPAKIIGIPKNSLQPENKDFWDPEVNFTWIDRHSPERAASPRKLTPSLDDQEAMKKKYTSSPQKKSEKKAFDAVKDEIARNFLRELDQQITEGRLEKLAESTGGLKTVWSNTLQTTAGRAHWRCKTTTRTTKHKDGSVTKEEERQHEASIELATKVLTNEDDLLNTVAHEFCHLAVFMLDGKPKMAHGREFKAWGAKCSKAFKNKGISVTTKHSYEIDYKYIWRCSECTCEVHRHTKSVDPQRQRCGRCRGGLVQVKPVPRVRKGTSPASTVPGEKKKLSAWQEFMSAQMAELKTTHKELAFDKKMEIISGRWKEHKIKLEQEKEEKELQAQLSAQFASEVEPNLGEDQDRSGVDFIVESVQALDLTVDGDSNVVDSTILV